MLPRGDRITASRPLLLDSVEFVPGCRVFELERPLLSRVGDQLRLDGDQVVVARASGRTEPPAGAVACVNRR